ncbi:MAG: efflux RND transporter periplasmic adaptor subunit [Deltaproteobacteria bacterium HGW-Deltaproteobacteria-6]|jgi:cobalt-zinc-cadmium efflux system membrane fusion protein|nr:MAG: efflux RND transporter periplasmic adaptor subunit [Deltaproteobacteria bacterium HGW-Deltaproteobacteria-6]
MIKPFGDIVKQGLLIAAFLLPGMAMMTAGCGKNDAQEKAKTAVVREAKESGHNESAEKEAHGMVTLSQEMQMSSGIEVMQVSLEEAAVPLSATAVIEMNMDRAARISPRVTGKAVKIIVSQGDRVKAGQALAYLDSVELDQIWADYRKAQGKVELARRNLQREETLFQKKISPEKDVLKARQELNETEADVNYAKERFRLVGVDVTQFASSKANSSHPLVPVASPVGGIVIEKAVTQGEVVNPDKTLFLVADLTTLWVVIDVYEKDASRLRVGTGVKVSVTAFPDKVFKGKISYVADVVDEKTRTEKARVTIDNASGLLKPGMFASVLIETKNVKGERLIAVPEEAVQIEGAARYVFVRVAPDKFARRDIEVGRTLGKNLEVTAGLKEGEFFAVRGAFILKSELKKGELEGDAH